MDGMIHLIVAYVLKRAGNFKQTGTNKICTTVYMRNVSVTVYYRLCANIITKIQHH